MKQFQGFKSEANSGGKYPMLPAGPYVAVIKAVKIDGVEPDQSLILRLDIAEGEYADYYYNRFKAEDAKGGNYPAKYKGDLRLRIPNPDNHRAMYPETDLRRFNDAMYRIEQSNPGYAWDWNEQGLVGRIVGLSVRGGTYNDSPYTKPYRLEIADDVRKGLVPVMQPMDPRSDAYEPPIDRQTGYAVVNDPSVPF